ncbi:MAG TPA: alcohol dehydrogenase catalytic domain-containing protein, partial [Acidobacteriota bacterium]|nr:alcohol dehydrogenase catalytic domain-containing protein [Acidobacteriota bacterium]
MRAMVLDRPGQPLVLREVIVPEPGPGQLLIKVHVCGVCRTDLHIVEGDLTGARLPIVPGHEIVGSVIRVGAKADSFAPGDRIGIPWLGGTCGECAYCLAGRENLCDRPEFTGYTVNGGYA